MPLAFTIDGDRNEAYPAQPPPVGLPENISSVLGMMRWASGAGFRDTAQDVLSTTIDDRLLPIKIGLIAVGGLALVTLLTVLAGSGRKG